VSRRTRGILGGFGGGFRGVTGDVFGGTCGGIGGLSRGVHRLRRCVGSVGAAGVKSGGTAREKEKSREGCDVTWFGAFHGERKGWFGAIDRPFAGGSTPFFPAAFREK
jgi:hypothetical protein